MFRKCLIENFNEMTVRRGWEQKSFGEQKVLKGAVRGGGVCATTCLLLKIAYIQDYSIKVLNKQSFGREQK